MSKILPLVIEPYPRLHQISSPIEVIDQQIKELAEDMLATTRHNRGIGLAAVQVGVLKRVVIIDIDHWKAPEETFLHDNKPLTLINPEITYFSKEKSLYKEGCLSFPNIHVDIERPSDINVKFLNLDGEEVHLELRHSLLSICIQHEIDHINGLVLTDHTSRLKKEMINKKLLKSLVKSDRH